MSDINLTVNGSTTGLEEGISFRDTVVNAARDAGLGKFRVILNGTEIDPLEAPSTMTSGMNLEIRPYEVAGATECSGGYCASQCYVNVCSTYVAPNSVWNYDGSGWLVSPGCASNVAFPTGIGDTIYDENIERLAGSINHERGRRGIADFPFDFPLTGSGESTPGDLIYGNNATQEMFKDIKTAINQIASGYVTYTVVDGSPVPWASIRQARNRIDTLRASCICNSDCGGHLVCACYNDCGCYY